MLQEERLWVPCLPRFLRQVARLRAEIASAVARGESGSAESAELARQLQQTTAALDDSRKEVMGLAESQKPYEPGYTVPATMSPSKWRYETS